MIMICERCFAEIGDSEPMVRLAHIDEAHPDGSITWVHTFLHGNAKACTPPQVADHERPDTGTWDATRGIGSRRP